MAGEVGMQASGRLGQLLAQHRLAATLSFRHRERCGRLIQGGSHKGFCSRQDGETCFRQRRTDYKCRERGDS